MYSRNLAPNFGCLTCDSASATTTTARPKSDDGGFNFFLENVADQRKKLQFIPGAIMMKDSEGNTVVKGGGLKLDDQVQYTLRRKKKSERFMQPFTRLES